MSDHGSRTKKAARLEALLGSLEHHTQRATYGAVGGLVGLPAQSVMHGRPKTPRNSWVVSAERELPTGYSPAERHPNLLAIRSVINVAADLERWWKLHP